LASGAKDVFEASRAISTETTRGFTVRGDFIAPLPATADEVEAIDAIAKEQGKTSNYYLEADANEAFVKQKIIEGYRFLHFATHGFVNEANPAFSGIFLSQQEDEQEDCILFASEIYGLELNTDLVTLSACETGLGRYAQGEGIVGLTRAFLYAGADNLLVSQWQVDDRSTSKLMIDFYQEMFDGATKTHALRKAKLNLINSDEHSSPYFWAPFVLIGE
jgi:CHAT domain-containing protein